MSEPAPGTDPDAATYAATAADLAAAFCATLRLEPGGSAPAPGVTLQPTPAGRATALAGDFAAEPLLRLGADLEPGEVLGEGGMGRVLSAHQRSLARTVALKTALETAGDPARAALLREARLTGALEHPNIVPVHALGLDDAGQPVLVMKRIEGVPWRALLQDPEHPAWELAGGAGGDLLARNLEVLIEVSEAVAYAHGQGVLHRDLKPDNVLIGRWGEVYLVDWGLAARTDEQELSTGGTPGYMAPEMLDGEATPRTDVYLLGAVLHEVLTGRRRHEGPTLVNVLASASRSAPVAYGPEVPPELAEIANRATHADPAARFPDPRAFRAALVAFLRHRGSRELAAAAAERLGALHAAATGGDAVAATRLSAEARFGFRQALEAWPENAAARAGLLECLELSIEQALAQQHPEAAQALLEELEALEAEADPPRGPAPEPPQEPSARPPADGVPAADAAPPSERAARRAQLVAWVARVRAEVEHARRLAADLDSSVSRPQRTLFLSLGLSLVVPISLTMLVLLLNGVVLRTVGALVAITATAWVSVVTLTLLARRVLFKNAFNRRVAGYLVLGLTGLLLHRLLGWRLGLSFVHVLLGDLVLGTVLAGSAALTFSSPGLVALAGVYALLAVGASFAPEGILWFFSAAVAATLLAVALFALNDWRQLRRER
ncbi:MAG: serine/threonine-protein kinase [Planctomycetota bacterium]